MRFLTMLICLNLLILSSSTQAKNQLDIQVSLPELDVNPYHKPYVAVWLETPNRQYVTTITLWADDMEWYKDLRQWWRKAGRTEQNFDGVTGATKKPGTYSFTWAGTDNQGKTVPPGNYIIKFEASREEGGREFLQSDISLDQAGNISLNGKRELGPITISIQTQE